METVPFPERLITRSIVPMFAEPDPASEQVSQALLGMPVRLVVAAGEWALIQTPDAYQGWAAAAGLARLPEAWREPWVEVEDLWINLRGKPHSRQAPVIQAVIGCRFPVVEEAESYCGILMPDERTLWVENHRVRRVGEEPLRPLASRAVCRTARRFLGVPYLWGGSSPAGLDCSGFVQLVLRLHGVQIERDAGPQSRQGEDCPDPEVADLVFFGPTERPDAITHVGLMLDDRRFIHALGSQYVRIDTLRGERFGPKYRFARRFVPRDPTDRM